MDKTTIIDPPWQVLLMPTKENVEKWLQYLSSLELDESVQQAMQQANKISASLV